MVEKVETNDLMDYFLLGAMKIGEERAMLPIIGNNTLQSGAIKTALGLGVAKMAGKNKLGKLLGMAFVIDGMEDVANNVMKGIPSLGVKPQENVLTI